MGMGWTSALPRAPSLVRSACDSFVVDDMAFRRTRWAMGAQMPPAEAMMIVVPPSWVSLGLRARRCALRGWQIDGSLLRGAVWACGTFNHRADLPHCSWAMSLANRNPSATFT